MDFKAATDDLFAGVSHNELALSLGVSVASIRQGRLSSSAKAYRAAPRNWKSGVERLARDQIQRLERLVEALDESTLSTPENRLWTPKPVRAAPRGRVSAAE